VLELVGSRGATFELTDSVQSSIDLAPALHEPARAFTAQEIRAALEKHHGVRERVWRELGMPNRHVLHRLMKKFGLGEEDGD
jgi:DNA-binding NtrC family response regulator